MGDGALGNGAMSSTREQGILLKSLTQDDARFFSENGDTFIALDLSVMSNILPSAARRAGEWPIASRQYPEGPKKAWEIKRYLSWHLSSKTVQSISSKITKNAQPGDWFAARYRVSDLGEVNLSWRSVSKIDDAVLWRTIDTATLGHARDRLQHWGEDHFLFPAMGNLIFAESRPAEEITEQAHVIEEQVAVMPLAEQDEAISGTGELAEDALLIRDLSDLEEEPSSLDEPYQPDDDKFRDGEPDADQSVQEVLPAEDQAQCDPDPGLVITPDLEICETKPAPNEEKKTESPVPEHFSGLTFPAGSAVSGVETETAVLAEIPVVRDDAQTVLFEDFNTAINDLVFDGRYRLAPVYLDLENDLICEICDRIGITAGKFEELLGGAVSGSISWRTDDPLVRHTAAFNKWVSTGRGTPPPFTAILCALSAAAGRMRQDDSFTAQNYYERLFELLHIDNDDKKQRMRGTGKSIRRFWEALNRWLAENDFEYGRPTARKVNSWPYVSYALSQALIREADVQRFHHMFQHFSMSPNDRLSEAEMEPYLYQWIRGSGPSQWLKKVWSSNDLRPRVVAAACAELERWDGSRNGETQSSIARSMFWIASLRSLPRREVRLFLTGPELSSDAPLNLQLVLGESEAASDAFSKCKDGLHLVNSPTGNFSVLEPTNKFSLSPLLQASLDLRGAETVAFKRAPRPIIPLLKLDTGVYFKEVSRTSFLRTHLVLCHERWKTDVAGYLRQHARPGYKEFDAKKIIGLPEDWYLFSEVEIISAADEVKDSLQVLVPLSDRAVLELSGGLRLGQGLWHSDVPPDVSAVSPHDGLSIDLLESHSLDATKALKHVVSPSNVCLLSLAGHDFPAGSELTVVVTDSDKNKSERSLSLRSADTPSRKKSEIGVFELAIRRM